MKTYPIYFIEYYKAGDTFPYKRTVKEHFYYREEVLIEAAVNLELTEAVKAIIRYKEVDPDSDACYNAKIIYEIVKTAGV